MMKAEPQKGLRFFFFGMSENKSMLKSDKVLLAISKKS
jgi:hypothetical protein